jgi:hypothetical protein
MTYGGGPSRSDSPRATARGFANFARTDGWRGGEWCGGYMRQRYYGSARTLDGGETRRIDEMVMAVGARRALRSRLDRCASPSCPIPRDKIAISMHLGHNHVAAATHVTQKAIFGSSSSAPCDRKPQDSGHGGRGRSAVESAQQSASTTYPGAPIRLAMHGAKTDSSRVGR